VTGVPASVACGAPLAALALLLLACGPTPDGEREDPGRVPIPGGAECPDGFRRAQGAREWTFPRDHGAHRAYATEWWYATGILRTREGRRFGYELTFFRRGLVPRPGRRGHEAGGSARGPRTAATPEPGPAAAAARAVSQSGERSPSQTPSSPWRARDLILAHAAVTDVAGRRFVVADRLERAAHGWAGADTLGMDVWIGDWRAAAAEGGFALRVPPESTGGSLGLDVRLASTRPPVLHGRGGLSPKDAGPRPHASWYVSLPRLQTRGSLTVEGESFEVSGHTWMDHEFFSGGLAEGQVGWDWFSARLEDGRDLMLFRVRSREGGGDHVAGTVTSADGLSSRALRIRRAEFEPLERWTSPSTGATYPVAWRVRLPAEGLELRTRTPLVDQEVETEAGVGFAYWEGLAEYTGSWSGERVRGEGYVEMTGYDAPVDLR